jgi:hypothetical protein
VPGAKIEFRFLQSRRGQRACQKQRFHPVQVPTDGATDVPGYLDSSPSPELGADSASLEINE